MRHSLLLLLFLYTIPDLPAQQVYDTKTFLQISKDEKSSRKRSKFKFCRKRHQNRKDSLLLDTNAVYVAANEIQPVSTDSNYVFYRFFKNAAFESGPYRSMPTVDDFENLQYGNFRCYKMKRKKTLVIEIPKRFQMDSKWIFLYSKIFSDRIEVTHYHHDNILTSFTSPSRLSNAEVYLKVKVDFKNRTYLWH